RLPLQRSRPVQFHHDGSGPRRLALRDSAQLQLLRRPHAVLRGEPRLGRHQVPVLGADGGVRAPRAARRRGELRGEPARRGGAHPYLARAGRAGGNRDAMMKIPFLDLGRQHRAIKSELLGAVERVLDSSQFVLGHEGRALEGELAALAGVGHGIGLASGTDALRLALTAIGVKPGDEVITPAFSFVASASTIWLARATPGVVDIEPVTCGLDPELLERALTPRTRAIIPVHLYGHP